MHNRSKLAQIYRTFVQMISTQFSKAIKIFRTEAALTVVYTINHLPSLALQNVTPFERLYGTPASYSSLRIFDCACFVLLQLHEHSKLKPRSRLCCFLGYEIKHKSYRCWDPISQRLRISRHVVFWEHTTFNSLSKLKTYSTPSFFTNPSLPLFSYPTSPDSSTILPIPPADSPVSPLAPSPDVDPALAQTSDLPPAAPPTDSPVSPQEPAPPVDLVTNQTPPFPLHHSDQIRAAPAHLRDYSCFSTVLSLHESHTYREECTNPLWQ